MRLDKFLGLTLCITRKQAKQLLRTEAVTVDGTTVKDGALNIDPQLAAVAVQGRGITYAQHLYIMMNKPAQVITAVRDNFNTTVMDVLPQDFYRRDLSPVGRLDKDTTGLLLFTTDGDFAHKVLSPTKHVGKTYLLTVDGPIPTQAVALFEKGLVLQGKPLQPAQLVINSEDPTRGALTIYEGVYHQVKRMMGRFDLTVTALHRQKVGDLILDQNLSPGQARFLTKTECEQVLK